jgi:AmmeMemoRadiSam system protein A
VLTEKERSELKEIAREAIEGVLFGKKERPREISEGLKKRQGVFVTLKKKGSLRGCIGYIRGAIPLYEAVRAMAIESAFHDPRFEPVSKDEWKDIEIEISVLSPLKEIKDIEEIEVGKHGLYIEKGFHSGLLLPQVAVENNWDRDTFLEYTCWKAGLPKDAWKSEDTKISIFSAEVF